MATESPFSNPGMGMLGTDTAYARGAFGDNSKPGLLGIIFADQIKSLSKSFDDYFKGKKDVEGAKAPPTENPTVQTAYEPTSVLGQQDFTSPYINANGSPIVPNAGLPPPTTSLEGFMTPRYRAPQPEGAVQPNPMTGFKKPTYGSQFQQPTNNQSVSLVDQLWGK